MKPINAQKPQWSIKYQALMDYFTRQTVERFFAQLPGWIFLLAGLTLLGFALVTPTWLQTRELKHQREVLRAQAQSIEEQSQAYEKFDLALKKRDPVLLERLAFYHLRLKPVGSQLLIGPESMNPPARTRPLLVANPRQAVNREKNQPQGALVAQRLSQSLISVEAWLQKPLPREGVEIKTLPPIESKLVKWSVGPMRMMLLAGAAVLVILGLLPSARIPRETTLRVPMMGKM